MSKVKKTNPHCPVAGCKTTAPLSFAKTLAGCEIGWAGPHDSDRLRVSMT